MLHGQKLKKKIFKGVGGSEGIGGQPAISAIITWFDLYLQSLKQGLAGRKCVGNV